MASPPSTAEDTLKTLQSDPLVESATSYIRSYMSNYDASHSFDHIQRVVRLSIHLYLSLPPSQAAPMDARAIILSALLHDVGDRKYISPGEDPTTLISSLLLSLSCPPALASKVQEICLAVSYTTEVKDPAKTLEVLARHPELGVVQDADRIDALGAVGLGRLFTFGGSKTKRSMQEGMDHLDEKLLKLEAMCKTEPGRRLAAERTERLRVFKEWWQEETGFGLERWEFEGQEVSRKHRRP